MITGWPTRRSSQETLLADGRPAIVRSLRPQDRPGLQMLFDAVSDAHLYTRFFTFGRSMVTPHLDHLLADGPGVATYVVVVADRIVGVCDVERLNAATAEVAFLVADDLHGQGIATILLERAAADARTAGVGWFVSDVLARNHEMIVVFTDIGFRVEMTREGSDVGVRMSTVLDPAAQEAAAARHAIAVARGTDGAQPTAVPKARPIA